MPFEGHGRVPGFADAWGERQPQWQGKSIVAIDRHSERILNYCYDVSVADAYLSYLTNVQTLLQRGRADVDVAIYHPATMGVKGGFQDSSLNGAGYSYGFVTDGLLARDDAEVEDKRLWNAGPGYRALIINQETAMSHRTAQRILHLARRGLPIVIIGDSPTTIPGLPIAGTTLAEADAAIRAVFQQIHGLPSCLRIPENAQVPEALRSLSIR